MEEERFSRGKKRFREMDVWVYSRGYSWWTGSEGYKSEEWILADELGSFM